jgi:hypothetical protein
MGDLMAVLMGPLPGCHHCDPSFLVDIGHAGLRLEVGVFLEGRAVGALHDHRRLPKGCLHIALADAVMAKEVARVIGMDLWGAGAQRFLGVINPRQVLIFHLDELHRLRRDLLALRRHQGHHIPLVADHIGAGLAVGSADHRLIEVDQAVFVHRHVLRREHRHHPRQRLGPAGVDPPDSRRRAAGPLHLQVELPRQIQIPRIGGPAGYLALRIDPWDRDPDGHG